MQEMKVELRFLLSAHRLIGVYICPKFHKHIFDGFKFIERTRFSYQKLHKGA